MQNIKFFDAESGIEREGEIIASGSIGDQQWNEVTVEGIYWAVPVGFPNNSSPICEESEPEAYQEIVAQLQRLPATPMAPKSLYTIIDRDSGEKFTTETIDSAERRRNELNLKYGKQFCLGVARIDASGKLHDLEI